MARKQSSSSRSKKQGESSSSRHSRSETESRASSRTTTDHDEIQEWAEQRGGIPACVQGTGNSDDMDMIRIEFPDAPDARDEDLEEIGWDEFFEKFDDADLAMVYQDTTASGEQSNFYELIKRERSKSAGAGG
jgi:hypothetical protein